jgi:sterol desaturase/sphingolipid hydroxylase (fatty acid hydroxylase superfamily)
MLLLYALLAKLLTVVPFMAVGLVSESIASKRRVPALSSSVNIGVMLLHQFAQIVFSAVVTVAVIRAMRLLPRPTWMPQPHADTWLSFIGWTMVLMVFLDFGYYWMHRAQHMVPVLWAQHAVHHSDEHFNVTTAWRIHWTEPILELGFMIVPSAYLFVTQSSIAIAIGAVSDGINAFAHLNVPTRWRWLHRVVITPQLHRTHHSYLPEHIDLNFAGKFPIWDRLFGTYREPDDPVEPPTGLHSGDRITSLWAAIVYPLKVWAGNLKRTQSPTQTTRSL